MSSRPPSRKPNNRYSSGKPLSSMATPRRPEPPKKMGLGGFIFLLLILGGLTWLLMLIFGWGPYQVAVSQATGEPTATAPVIVSASEEVSETVQPTNTDEPTLMPTITPTPTLEPMPFTLEGEPETLTSDLLRPGLGCDVLIIAGQVKDLKDDPIKNLTLHLFGELGGFEIDLYRIAGSEPTYGESGYEFLLEGLVVESEDTLYIQLVDTNDIPFSRPYAVQTFAECQKNLILINFKQVR
ncbi:MAG: hypothetical protein SVR81_00430 [Chloroflexota bacterium]|nr:hypothetical protein [Chloroflexota bacterium]